MPFEIRRTAADLVVRAAEACLLKGDGAESEFVAEFLDAEKKMAEDALFMAVQLSLVSGPRNGHYYANRFLVCSLISGSNAQRAAVLRFQLEQYPPYTDFRARLSRTEHDPRHAAQQVRALHKMSAHRDDISMTLTDLGQYAMDLKPEGAGLVNPATPDSANYLLEIGEVADDREANEAVVRRRLGDSAAAYVNKASVLDELVLANQKLRECASDPKTPIQHAGSAVESFLKQVAQNKSVTAQKGASIIKLTDDLRAAGVIATKHLGPLHYLGHLRNAVDHGTDSEVKQTWCINPDTAVCYVNVSILATRSLVDHLAGRAIL